MPDWLYEKVRRVPEISDEQIAEMRHIEPLVKMPESIMYRRVKGVELLDPRSESCIWNAEPVGGEFSFDMLNTSTIITQHDCAYLFKPLLSEVYAWIRVYLPETWHCVSYFCLGEPTRIAGTTSYYCECEIMGGPTLIRGKPFTFPGGQQGFELVPGIPG